MRPTEWQPRLPSTMESACTIHNERKRAWLQRQEQKLRVYNLHTLPSLSLFLNTHYNMHVYAYLCLRKQLFVCLFCFFTLREKVSRVAGISVLIQDCDIMQQQNMATKRSTKVYLWIIIGIWLWIFSHSNCKFEFLFFVLCFWIPSGIA